VNLGNFTNLLYGYRTVSPSNDPVFPCRTSKLLIVLRFRKAGYQAIDRICDYYYSIQDRNVLPDVEPGYLRQHIPSEPFWKTCSSYFL